MQANTMPARFFLYGFLCLMFGMVPGASATTTYSTTFPAAENPISESAKWIDGKAAGMDWASVRTSVGFAYGTQTDTVNKDDSTAVLAGTWAADQSAWARVHTVNQSSSLTEEVEIWLRTTISTHSITGYKVSFRCTADGSQYVQIMRWNGPFASAAIIATRTGPGLHDGDQVKATINGSTITAFINGRTILSATDSTFTSGSPGMGFYIQGGSASQESDYGFTSFAATDKSAAQATSEALSSSPSKPSLSSLATSGQTYTTNFPLTENPISEGGKWINGGAVGLDWGNVQTTTGLAFGTVVSGGPPYSDSTAVLTGTWGSDQTAQATVHTVNQNSNIFEEVELRLRTTVTAHNITGYEFNFRCTADGTQYAQIVRWNGALNSFTQLNGAGGPGLHNGDVVKATAIGNTLTSYINGVQVVQWTDSTFTGGSPGIGFYNQGGTLANNSDYGFVSFTATDSSTTQKPNPPTGLTAIVN